MKIVETFETLLDRCHEFDRLKHDSMLDTTQVRFDENGDMIVPAAFGAMTLHMEDLALNQLAARLGPTFWQGPKRVVPSDLYRQLNRCWPQRFADLSHDLLDKQDGKMLVRAYDQNVRAVLSNQYVTLDNADVLDTAAQVLQRLPYEIVQSGQYYSRNDGIQRDEMAVRVVVKNVLPPDEPSGYGIGVLIRNGETGGSASEIRPLIMRTTCLNSLVFKTGAQGEMLGLRLTHRGQKTAKTLLMAAAIAEALPMAENGLARFLATREQQIDLAAVIDRLGDDHGWSEEMRVSVGMGSEGQSSVYGLVNGISYAAHEVEVDTTARLDLESLAAQLVYQPRAVLQQ